MWGPKHKPENATQQCSGVRLYSQKLLALASPLHIFFRVSWSGVVPITATQPLLKSTNTPSRSQYTFLEQGGLRRLGSPPRATEGLSDIPDTGNAISFQVVSDTCTKSIQWQQCCCIAMLQCSTSISSTKSKLSYLLPGVPFAGLGFAIFRREDPDIDIK